MYDYYRLLLMQFIESKLNIARCKCCGKFFIPKTKKMTLYCDRAIWNGRTCKEVAHALKHKLNAEKDKVIEAFDKAKRKMYKRYERSRDSEHELPKGLTYASLYEWMERAEEVRNRYLSEELTENYALRIIEGE